MLSTVTSYKLLTQNIEKSLARVRAAPEVNRETDYYLATIGKIKTIEDFLANDRVFAYAMKAFGLNPGDEGRYVLQFNGADVSDKTKVGKLGTVVVLKLALADEVAKG